MKVILEFFGPVRDRMSDSPGTLTLDPVPHTFDALILMLADRLENGSVLRDPHLRFAINDELVTADGKITLGDGDRIAILSPFSGG